MDLEFLESTQFPVPGREYYCSTRMGSTFKPWLMDGELLELYRAVEGRVIATIDCCYYLLSLARQASAVPGEYWEAGVYRGGTALVIARAAGVRRVLRLFDTFSGIPSVDPEFDLLHAGQFDDCSQEEVEQSLGHPDCRIHSGEIPATFAGLESSRIAFLHCDVSTYRATRDVLAFAYPRVERNGIILLAEYGQPSKPGIRAAVDEFFRDKVDTPIVLKTGQVFVIKVF
jgi:O-methyltransferase